MQSEPQAHTNVRIISKHCEIFRLTVAQSQYIKCQHFLAP